jgi:hypothetical protein
MATILPTTHRRATQRASHLRQVSNGSVNSQSRPTTGVSDAGTAQYDPVPPKVDIERRCSLWVHEESFAKDEVVLNLDLLPGVKPGDLMAIISLKTDSGLRDFQEKAQQTFEKDVENMGTHTQREHSIAQANGDHIKHDIDMERRYLFIAKDMCKDLKAKHPSLEVSVTKHIADVFGFKQRASVLVTTVGPFQSRLGNHANSSFRPILPHVLHLTSNCPSKTNILRGLTCGDWQLVISVVERFLKDKKYCSWGLLKRM